jgi:biotin transport system substrate-specific component
MAAPPPTPPQATPRRPGGAEPALAGIHRLVWTALLAACITVGAWFQLPIGPVPVTLQPLFVFLAGYLLGPAHGAGAVALYVLAGVVGIPVFAGGHAGLGVLLGPTGGFLVGFVLAAGVAGLAARRRAPRAGLSWARGLVAGVAALAVAYAVGVAWLARVLHLGPRQAVVVGVLPFVGPDLVKVAVAVAVARRLRAHRLAPP